jgi:hypothetical protein
MAKSKYPSSVNIRRKIHTIDGSFRYFTVEDEIICKQHVTEKKTKKLIYFQKIRFEKPNEIQYRLTYYMRGVKPDAKGRWVFGQYSLMIPAKQLSYLLKEARKRKWEGI